MLNSRKEFANLCIGLKSRAAMFGKRNYLAGPNALTSWCIVLAGVIGGTGAGQARRVLGLVSPATVAPAISRRGR